MELIPREEGETSVSKLAQKNRNSFFSDEIEHHDWTELHGETCTCPGSSNVRLRAPHTASGMQDLDCREVKGRNQEACHARNILS